MNKLAKNNNKTIDRISSGVTGAMIGAGVAIAATKVLSDKKTKAKVKKTLLQAKKQLTESVNLIKHGAKDAQKIIRKQFKQTGNSKKKTAKK